MKRYGVKIELQIECENIGEAEGKILDVLANLPEGVRRSYDDDKTYDIFSEEEFDEI